VNVDVVGETCKDLIKGVKNFLKKFPLFIKYLRILNQVLPSVLHTSLQAPHFICNFRSEQERYMTGKSVRNKSLFFKAVTTMKK
jgi:hypothetical protein